MVNPPDKFTAQDPDSWVEYEFDGSSGSKYLIRTYGETQGSIRPSIIRALVEYGRQLERGGDADQKD